MVLKPEPLVLRIEIGRSGRFRCEARAAEEVCDGRPSFIFRPRDSRSRRRWRTNWPKMKRLVLVAGHYEGIDERIFDWVDLEVSVGDVVLTGGEIPAMALVDAVVRKVPGVVKETASLEWDSFAGGWEGRLDCPHFTRPAEWRGRSVPDVLLGGTIKKIQAWRSAASTQPRKRNGPI
jgi:tRNA (guanine37-N1)-methyltransferase